MACSATYHTHTLYSDGKATIAAMVAAAQARGFTEIGISDHLVLHPELPNADWAMAPARLEQYVAEVRAVAAQQPGIRVRLGLEVDWFPNSPRNAELTSLLQQQPFDYLIGSVHFVDCFAIDSRAADWAALSPAQIDQVHRRYWQAIADLARHNQLFQMVGHLDLPKKFNYPASAAILPEVDSALGELARAGLCVEINTAGWDKPCQEAYPAPGLLRRCRELGIAVLLSDDAHSPDELGRHFERARQLVHATGVTLLPALPFPD